MLMLVVGLAVFACRRRQQTPPSSVPMAPTGSAGATDATSRRTHTGEYGAAPLFGDGLYDDVDAVHRAGSTKSGVYESVHSPLSP